MHITNPKKIFTVCKELRIENACAGSILALKNLQTIREGGGTVGSGRVARILE